MTERLTIPEPIASTSRAGSIALTGHDELVLQDSGEGYLIRKGHLSVYLVRLEGGIPVGRRRYLFTCHEGCLMTAQPVRDERGEYALLAVALAESRCDRVQLYSFGRTQQELHAANFWCDHLCRGLAERFPADYTERSDAGGRFSMESGQKIRPPSAGLYLLNLERGQVALFGQAHLKITPSTGSLLVLGDTWFGVEEQAAGEFALLQSTKERTGLTEAFGRLSELYIKAVREIDREEEGVERARLARLSALREKQKGEAIRHLSFAEDLPRHITSDKKPLLACLDAIARETGIKLDTESPTRAGLSVHEELSFITRKSGTRIRKVRLSDDWWEADVGTILAFTKAGQSPVALINVSRYLGLSRHYEIFDPATGQQVPLTPEIAQTLVTDAYVFLRPMPVADGPVTFPHLARFTFKPFITDVRLVLLLALAGGVLAAALPLGNRLMIDEVIPDANRSLLYDLAIGLGVMSLGIFLFNLSQGLVSLRVKTGLTAHLQTAVIDRLLRLPTRFFRKYSSGDMLNRAMMITEISGGFSMSVLTALLSLFSTIVMLAICFYYSSKLAWLALIAAIVTSISSLTFSFLIRSRALELTVKSGKLFGVLVQMVHGVSKLQTAGAETRAFSQWAKEYGHQLQLQYRINYLSHWSTLINTAIQTLSTMALYYFAGTMVQQSEQLRSLSPLAGPLMTIGTFFAVQAAFSAVVGGVGGFFGTFLNVHQMAEKRKLVRPILEEPIEGGVGRIDPGRLDGHIQVKRVSFRYSASGPLVLREVDLEAYPGQFVAVVGTSGGGKSTLLKLLLGFETPESGQILFDKKDVKDLDMIAVRRQTGVVLQDGKVNAGTIFHNISGAAQMSLEDAWEAAEAAGMGDDIRGLPMGMHTLVPEGGTTLSGGQRQRLLIARALALKPRIIFFDEATSALDNRTQEIVTRNLNQRRITRLIVAHRLSTIIGADRIYVFDQGAVVQSGSFHELIAREGLFKELAGKQMA